MKTYTFHVSIPGTGRVWRKIEMGADQTLAQLHLAIQDAFDFDNDHLYSFFMSGRAWDKDTEYSLPEGVPPWSILPEAGDGEEEATDGELVEAEEEELTPVESESTPDEVDDFLDALWADLLAIEALRGERDVRKVTVGSLDLEVGETFMYLFDYGDEWRFKVRVHAVDEDAPEDADYPLIVEEVGEPPSQYGSWDEDEEWW